MLNRQNSLKTKSSGKRRGAIWPLLIACLGLLLAGIALAVDAALIWHARQEIQVAVDAGSLAAIGQLADDSLLLQRPGAMYDAVNRAQRSAQFYAGEHSVLGSPLVLDIDSTDPDVRFGYHDPVTRHMQPAAMSELDSPFLNAVFTRIFRLPSADVTARATAILDKQVIGFRPVGGIPAPVMPIAVLSDPSGMEELAWEAQIDKPLSTGSGLDQYAFDKSTRHWRRVCEGPRAGDGLPEMTVRLPLSDEEDASLSNGAIFHSGRVDERTWLRQVATGFLAADLEPWNGELALGWDGNLRMPLGRMPTGRLLEDLVRKLNTLQSTGEPRVWPLYSPGGQPLPSDILTGSPDLVIRGFVSARIAEVQLDQGEHPALLIVLQPTITVTGTALTQAAAEVNPYIAKARLLR